MGTGRTRQGAAPEGHSRTHVCQAPRVCAVSKEMPQEGTRPLPTGVSEREVAQSCPALCDPMDCSPPGSSVHGVLQARILEWVAVPSSRGIFPTQGSNRVSCIAGRFFTEPPGEPHRGKENSFHRKLDSRSALDGLLSFPLKKMGIILDWGGGGWSKQREMQSALEQALKLKGEGP